MKKRLLITHYDLDGMGCDVMLSNMFDITKKHYYGYSKIKECIESPRVLTYDSVLVTDVSLTTDQFKRLYGHYNEAFLFVDHHPASLELINEYDFGNNPRPTCFVDDKMSATGLIAANMNKYFRVSKENISPLFRFATYVDAYDMWRFKTHPDLFKMGYDLNTIFWKLGFGNFFSKFKTGFRGFDADDRRIIRDHEEEKKKSLDGSEKCVFNGDSVFVFGTESKYVNDYTLNFPEYKVFYILYMYDDMPRIGIRTTLEGVKLGEISRKMVNKFECVMSAGGHPQAAGVDFLKDTSVSDISLVVEEIDKEIRDGEVK